MITEKKAKRFVSVRLTEEEFQEVYRQCESSACRSLTEYVKKVLTKRPVTIKVRNQSQDELLTAMIDIKNRLDQLTEQAREMNSETLLRELAAIRQQTAATYERLSQ